MLKAQYKSFKDLFNATYDMIYSKEKDEFSCEDAMVVTLFSIALDSLCGQFNKEIDKEREED